MAHLGTSCTIAAVHDVELTLKIAEASRIIVQTDPSAQEYRDTFWERSPTFLSLMRPIWNAQTT